MRQRVPLDDDSFGEIVIWQLPKPLPGSPHDYKYRLALVSENICVLRYDNEAGKGDHKHVGEKEMEYEFKGIDRLLDDFYGDIELWRLR